MKKQCNKCQKEKDVSEYKKHPETKDKLNGSCRICLNEIQRKYRASDDNIYTKVYEKTKNGFLMRLYRNMKSRSNGVQKAKHHLYEGKNLLNREDFYSWALGQESFHRLFENYKNSKYAMKLAPSVDRINSDLGYIIGNMEFITHSENSSRGSKSIKKKIPVSVSLNGVLIGEYPSMSVCASELGLDIGSVSLCISGRLKKTKGFKIVKIL